MGRNDAGLTEDGQIYSTVTMPFVKNEKEFKEKVLKLWQLYDPSRNKDIKGRVLRNLDNSTKVIQFKESRNVNSEVE